MAQRSDINISVVVGKEAVFRGGFSNCLNKHIINSSALAPYLYKGNSRV